MKFPVNRVSRRGFLRGTGVTLALPLVESLVPDRVYAQATAAPIKRLVYWFIPNGVLYDEWVPKAVGNLDAATLPISLKGLADASVLGDVNIISGLDNFPAVPTGLGDHASGVAGLMTCATAVKSVSNVSLGASADQLAAKAIGNLTPRPSLELGMVASGGTGDCDNGYACSYAQSMAWVDAKTPKGKRTDPHDAWLFLLGTDQSGLTPEQRARLRNADKSVLDYVMGQATNLNKKVGTSDRAKLDQYFTSVRATEQQLGALDPPASCRMQPDPGTGGDYVKRFNAMMELQLFALKCDLTRVITFMFGNAFGPGPMPWIGIADDYHALTHRTAAAGVRPQILKCIDWEVRQVAAFITKLKTTVEGPRTLLYNTTFMTSSDVGEGGIHNHHNMPVILAGSGTGTLKPGRHIAYAPENPNARTLALTREAPKRDMAIAMGNTNRFSNLHLTLLKNTGVTVDKFGDSGGVLTGL